MFILVTVGCIIFGLLCGKLSQLIALRLPQNLNAQWQYHCHEFLQMPLPRQPPHILKSLITKLPTDPHHKKRTYILSVICASAFYSIYLKFGLSWQTPIVCLLIWALITQSAIDLQHQILPDEITMPLLWLGLWCSLIPILANSHDAILGASIGYLGLWLINAAFYAIRKKQGMGHGDFKLAAMLGAWLGWQALPSVILCAAVLGSIVGLLVLCTKKQRDLRIPFGPFLAIAGWIVMLVWPYTML